MFDKRAQTSFVNVHQPPVPKRKLPQVPRHVWRNCSEEGQRQEARTQKLEESVVKSGDELIKLEEYFDHVLQWLNDTGT